MTDRTKDSETDPPVFPVVSCLPYEPWIPSSGISYWEVRTAGQVQDEGVARCPDGATRGCPSACPQLTLIKQNKLERADIPHVGVGLVLKHVTGDFVGLRCRLDDNTPSPVSLGVQYSAR